eukprot:gene1482-2110_t
MHMMGLEDSMHMMGLEDSMHMMGLEDSMHMMVLEDSMHMMVLEDSMHMMVLEDSMHMMKLRYVTMMWEAKDVMETSFDNLIVFCFHVFFFINREIMFVMIRQALTVMKRKKISLCQ